MRGFLSAWRDFLPEWIFGQLAGVGVSLVNRVIWNFPPLGNPATIVMLLPNPDRCVPVEHVT